jgi:HEAT repeats
MTEKIRSALETHAEDPRAAGEALRFLMNEDSERFLRASLELARTEQDTPALERLMQLLANHGAVMQKLCDPELFDRKTSVELAQRLARAEPQLDTRLVRLLPGRDSMRGDAANLVEAERILELLDAISGSARITSSLVHLISDPNARLRAKATLLIGRRVRSLRAVEERLKETDSRVRANVVESLWGEKAGWAAEMLWRAAKDPNNRVAGNALFGLYELRDQRAAPCILRMATDPNPNFRATAAWTMGETGDPQFIPALEKLSHDLYASVRRNASKALERIGK